MTMERRLSKLEPPVKAAHKAAWARFWSLYEGHTDFVLRAALRSPQFEAYIRNDDDDGIDWNLPEPFPAELDAWFQNASADLPDQGTAPDLISWPDDFPVPPDEPDGLWNRLWGYLDDPTTQASAGHVLLTLAFARAVRDYRQNAPVQHTQPGGLHREH